MRPDCARGEPGQRCAVPERPRVVAQQRGSRSQMRGVWLIWKEWLDWRVGVDRGRFRIGRVRRRPYSLDNSQMDLNLMVNMDIHVVSRWFGIWYDP